MDPTFTSRHGYRYALFFVEAVSKLPLIVYIRNKTGAEFKRALEYVVSYTGLRIGARVQKLYGHGRCL